MIDMRSVIMEINKDYCIVATEDGQFLRQVIPAGTYEIGDELIIEEAYEQNYALGPRRSWIKGIVAAAAVIVILTTGSVLLVRYFRQYTMATDTAMVAQEDMVEKAVEEKEVFAAEAAPAEGLEEPALAEEIDGAPTNIIFEGVYPLIEGTTAEEHIRKLIFSFTVTENRELQVKLENISSEYIFNGRVDLILLYEDGTRARMIPLEMLALSPGEATEEVFLLESGEEEAMVMVSEDL